MADIRIVIQKKTYNIDWSDLPSDNPENDMFVSGSEEEINGKNIRTFVVIILATNKTNGTELSCQFADTEIEITGTAKLYVAKGIT